MAYQDLAIRARSRRPKRCSRARTTWDGINAEAVARMRLQNRFKTGLDIARYTAAHHARATWPPMTPTRPSTPSRSAAGTASSRQQKMISIKKHFGTTERRYLYLSGWMVAALRSEFGPLPDQSMHEKTSVPALIEELYTFLRQADARELGMHVPRPRRRPRGRRRGQGTEAARRRSTTSRPTSCRSSPTSTPASAMPRRPTCWPRR